MNTFPASDMKPRTVGDGLASVAAGAAGDVARFQPGAGNPLQVQCAWCRMWRVDGQWVSMPLTGATGAVSHGICPPCSGAMLKGVLA
jgi:hypothetical protein